MKGYVMYLPKAQPEVNKPRIHEVPRNSRLIFHMGVTVVNNSRAFSLIDCSVTFKITFNTSSGKINAALSKFNSDIPPAFKIVAN